MRAATRPSQRAIGARIRVTPDHADAAARLFAVAGFDPLYVEHREDGDVIVRLRACETTAPWEIQQLTGAFVQLDVADPKGAFHRVFSGWLYKETPSLNVAEHPIYDVWPKSCAMSRPGDEPAAPANSAASNRSSAPKSPRASAPPLGAPRPSNTAATASANIAR